MGEKGKGIKEKNPHRHRLQYHDYQKERGKVEEGKERKMVMRLGWR